MKDWSLDVMPEIPYDYSYLDLERIYLEALELKGKESRGAFLKETCRKDANLLRGIKMMFEAAESRSAPAAGPKFDR